MSSILNQACYSIESSRAEAGCLEHDVMIGSKDSNLIILIVKFVDLKTMHVMKIHMA